MKKLRDLQPRRISAPMEELLRQMEDQPSVPDERPEKRTRKAGGGAKKASPLVLKDGDRGLPEELRKSGSQTARSINKAHVLVGLARGVDESILMQVLDVGRTTIWRVRKTYEAHGLPRALEEAKRTGRPKKKVSPPTDEPRF
jgi:hypothetical protein